MPYPNIRENLIGTLLKRVYAFSRPEMIMKIAQPTERLLTRMGGRFRRHGARSGEKGVRSQQGMPHLTRGLVPGIPGPSLSFLPALIDAGVRPWWACHPTTWPPRR